ncbi:hypothetical protein BU16DRAFT_560215 [Lophium mytilinum]|uniref:Uncharacterized protein n=1 Tax=Lophium mytilinum TaxID=390894 RepID=A0A6A6QWT2_9PEZI|nr:hypothetical protein BU16DRAFT_560215 [Lophium mytilinum]
MAYLIHYTVLALHLAGPRPLIQPSPFIASYTAANRLILPTCIGGTLLSRLLEFEGHVSPHRLSSSRLLHLPPLRPTVVRQGSTHQPRIQRHHTTFAEWRATEKAYKKEGEKEADKPCTPTRFETPAPDGRRCRERSSGSPSPPATIQPPIRPTSDDDA